MHKRAPRLSGFDYAQAGAYFVTICVAHRECLLGSPTAQGIEPNDAGEMVAREWNRLHERFSYASPNTFVAMPNHVHGLLVLDDRDCRENGFVVGADARALSDGQRVPDPVTQGRSPGWPAGTLPRSLGRVIQAFKSITTHGYVLGVAQRGWPPFAGRLWQPGYYDRIVRNEAELQRVREYIAANPYHWDQDEENPGRAVAR